MIESISITDVATFGSSAEVLHGLAGLNYLFGSNGTGKTTIARVIADEGAAPSCKVVWKGGTRLQSVVYNSDFVAKNFEQSPEIPGIFTLGEQQVDTIKRINAAKAEVDELTKKIEGLTATLQGEDGSGGKTGESAALEDALRHRCWAQKQKHDAAFAGAFKGVRDAAEKFKTRVLQEKTSNRASVEDLKDLERRAETLFGSNPTTAAPIPAVDFARLEAHASNPVLGKKVVGKADVDIAAMIQRLQNSDWVREGLGYFETNGGRCPFCQQGTSEAFAKSLSDYFDETFDRDSRAIDELVAAYRAEADRVLASVDSILDSGSSFVDVAGLRAERATLATTTTLNQQRLASKKKIPSQSVALEPLSTVVSAIGQLVGAANSQVDKHNSMVANLAAERKSLTAQVWKYLLEVELKADLTDYDLKRQALSKAMKAIEDKIALLRAEKDQKLRDISELEKTTTSIQPTIDAVNALLGSFGFRCFKLSKAESGTCYKLVRPDGSDAKKTLSEGERAFVTFLYFYHLLKGSESESGMTRDRVVVFDDPVSSLDCDVLFIVSSLIRGLVDEVRAGAGHIKQIFVLTHNVYFHKEVTFNTKRGGNAEAMGDETFWLVRKVGDASRVERHAANPVKTSYEMLWAEVRRPEPRALTLPNTLRRILEYYFKILGGAHLDDLCNKFEGQEKFVCRCLLSWVHGWSHHAHDDLFLAVDDSKIATYLSVFRSIFEKTGQSAHLKMMMGET
ncbi:MAG: AAA family ATPase [Deltaproteobacteria bacterium]|nr:AAA family ATPase [Deltaproteobacteria bacterium]